MPFGPYFDKFGHFDPIFLMLSLPNREIVEKRTFYNHADRKRLPPPLPLQSAFGEIFSMCFLS